jgi:hypothetical protein
MPKRLLVLFLVELAINNSAPKMGIKIGLTNKVVIRSVLKLSNLSAIGSIK